MFPYYFDPLEPAPAPIKAIVAEVAGAVGVPVPIVMTDHRLTEMNAYTSKNTKGEFGIFLPDNPISLFGSVDNLRAAIAHELGHVAHDDIERTKRFMHKREYDADDFATAHGFNVAPILKRTPSGDSESHPSPVARLKRIERRSAK